MPSAQSYRIPVWVPLAIIAVAIIAVVCCGMHLSKRVKANWPW